jgi:hypothetical protein
LEAPRGPSHLVTPRSLLLGLAGVVFICGLTPYNDYVVNNTFLIGNFLPVGLLLFFLLFVFLVNGPLSKWSPRLALSGGELAVAMSMALVSCSLPSSGLMRYLPNFLAYIPYQGGMQARYGQLLEQMHLPTWLFPTIHGSDAISRGHDPAISGYVGRIATNPDTFLAHWHAVPWAAWLIPAISWGIFLAALYAAIFCLAVIVRRQWVENERLPFPLVTVYASLIEPPEPGRAFNSLFRSRSFWVATGFVFFLHGINALHAYLPKNVPAIPLSYNLADVFVNEPWNRLGWHIKISTVYFCVVGIAYFIQSSVGFSLWFFVLLIQGVNLVLGKYQMQTTGGMQSDQLFGGVVAFAAMALWIGRAQWALVLRHMLGRRRFGDAQDIYLPYAVAGWGLIVACGVMIGWLLMAGTTVAGAFVLVGMVLLMMMVIARIVAETGLPFAQLTSLSASRPWLLISGMAPGMARTTNRNFFLTSLVGTTLVHDLREASSVYITHALRLVGHGATGGADVSKTSVSGASISGVRAGASRRWGVIAALALAMLAGYVVSGASTLFCEYRYASTLDQYPSTPINPYAAWAAQGLVLDPSVQYASPSPALNEQHSHTEHLLLGAAITAALAMLRLRFAAWPLHPVGYLLAYSYPMDCIWFSLMIGWLAKMFTLRLGGLRGFNAARPMFLGLIVGEAAAAAFWLIISLLLNTMGLPYHPIKLLPG